MLALCNSPLTSSPRDALAKGLRAFLHGNSLTYYVQHPTDAVVLRCSSARLITRALLKKVNYTLTGDSLHAASAGEK